MLSKHIKFFQSIYYKPGFTKDGKYCKPTGKLYERNNNCSKKDKQANYSKKYKQAISNDADNLNEPFKPVVLNNQNKPLSSVSSIVSSIGSDFNKNSEQMINDGLKSTPELSIGISEHIETVVNPLQDNNFTTDDDVVSLTKEFLGLSRIEGKSTLSSKY